MNSILRKTLIWFYKKLQAIKTDTWSLSKDYVDIDPTVILGVGSNVDIKYRPLQPGVCVKIGADSQIFGSLVIQRPGAMIRIGKRTQIGNSKLIAADKIEIGDDVLMAWDVTIIDNDSHSLYWDKRKNDVMQCGIDYRKVPEDFTRNKDWTHVKVGPVIIKEKVWIGYGVSILKGVTVGEGVVIGACSVVTRDVPPFCAVAGNPARIIRHLGREHE